MGLTDREVYNKSLTTLSDIINEVYNQETLVMMHSALSNLAG